ncbi:MAG: hypothetical protein K2X97_12865 [Mycobacteriaceae bacterium]|nr:hypothetical protein [Mycobacteriaceae bacterium]
MTVLATDLLVGILIGILVKFAFHLWNGAPVRSMIRPAVIVDYPAPNQAVVSVKDSAVFSSWIGLRRQIENLGDRAQVTLNFSDARFVDHTVMERLFTLQREFSETQRSLVIVGLESHASLSAHPLAARRRRRIDDPTPEA